MRDGCLRVVLLMLTCSALGAQTGRPVQTPKGTFLEAFPAHHVIGNVYFVGSKSLGIYLISTPQGHILINAGFGHYESPRPVRGKFRSAFSQKNKCQAPDCF